MYNKIRGILTLLRPITVGVQKSNITNKRFLLCYPEILSDDYPDVTRLLFYLMKWQQLWQWWMKFSYVRRKLVWWTWTEVCGTMQEAHFRSLLTQSPHSYLETFLEQKHERLKSWGGKRSTRGVKPFGGLGKRALTGNLCCRGGKYK